MVLIAVGEQLLILVTTTDEFHGKGHVEIRFGASIQLCDDLLIFQGDICILNIREISDICASSWISLIAGSWVKISFSNQIEDFSGTDVTDRSFILRYLLSYLSPFSAHCTGSQFFEFVRPQGWLQFWIAIPFFSAFSCYEQPMYSF